MGQNKEDKFTTLREKAEELLFREGGKDYEEEVEERKFLDLLQELTIYQTELEIQNEELKSSRNEIAALQREYADLYEFAPCGYVTISKTGIISRINLRGVVLLGKERSILTRTSFSFFVAPESRNDYREALTKAEKTGEKQELECRLKTQDKRGFLWVQADYNDDGTLKQWRLTIVDITKLKDSMEKAEEMERLKTTFFSSLSHEIRTPLTAIIGFIDIVLQENGIEPEHKNYLELAKESGNILLLLINDILDFSRIENRQLTLEKTSFSLSEVFDGVGTIAKILIRDKGKNLELRRATEELEDLSVIGDPYRLEQVLINLLNNAVKFTDTGYIEYGVSFKNRDTLEFYVQDTGVGIPPEKKKLIFEPFRQAEEKTARKHGGTGLGLSISKSLIELMGGEIRLLSTPGEGTTFFFTLPYIAGKKELQWEKEYESAGKGILPEMKKVLLAEDNHINQLVITKILEKWGYEIVLAEDGREAISLLENNPDIGLVLMDVYMPNMDGIEATRKIRKMEEEGLRKRIPIFAFTASSSKEDNRSMYEAGFDEVIEKPVDRDTLFKALSDFSR